MDRKIIGFDICGTLFDSNTTFDFIDFLSDKNYIKNNFKILRTFPFKIVNKFSIKTFGVDLVKIFYLRGLSGISEDELKEYSKIFYDEFLVRKMNFQVKKLLLKYKSEEATVLFISATIDCIAQEIGVRLGADTVISSKVEIKEGLATGRLVTDIYGDKLRYISKRLDCYVSDNLNDVSILSNSRDYVVVTNIKNLGYWNRVMGKNFNRILV